MHTGNALPGLLAALCLAGLAAQPAAAATFVVNSTADQLDASPGNGVCATSGGACTLRAAVQEANALGGSDTITVPAGTYVLSIIGSDNNAQRGDLDITSTIVINGVSPAATFVDGNANDRVFDVRGGGNATLTGLTVQNGDITGTGGGINNLGTLSLTDVALTGNTSGTGAGNNGGGFYNTGTVNLLRVTISGNTSNRDGGGFQSDGGSVTGTNVTISGNSASDNGGGFETEAGTVSLTNVTITDNAGPGGGAISLAGGTVNLQNTIVANSVSGGNCDGGSPNSLGNNLDSGNTCGLSGPGDLVNTNPQLGPLQDNGGLTDTHALGAASPAIDAASNAACTATDQRGVGRPLDGDGDTTPVCDVGSYEHVPPIADLALAVTDTPDPAPLNGPLLYTLLVTNNGPATATNVTVVNTLHASVTLVSATPNQGTCSGDPVVTCSLGSIINGGTASIEILVTTNATGTVTNSATVSSDLADNVPGNNTDNENTTVVSGGTTDIPLTQYARMHGFLDYVVTGGTLRTSDSSGQRCDIQASSSGSLAGIPGTATVRAAYLYWAASGVVPDVNITLDGAPLTADRNWEAGFVLGGTTYEFFGGFRDVTAQVTTKGNGLYTFAGLTIDNGNPWCSASAVLGGWSMYVIYEDTSVSGKTLVLYDGFDLERNGSTSYLLTGIYASAPPEAKTSSLLWEGDAGLGGSNERLLFNGAVQSDALNPINNIYNSTINSIGSSTTWGADLDTFDVSGLVAAGDTLATTQVDTGPDLVILNSVLLQVKTNIIAGTVFEDVNYGGGAGRDLATAAADAPTFAVPRPGVTVELYDVGGNLLRSTVTDPSGDYGFTGLADGNYTVRVVNDTVTSSRPGSDGSEWPVQTFRSDATGASVVAVTGEVGGADPTAQDDPANGGGLNLGSITAQSLAPVNITAATAKSGVDFGFNFDTVVNANETGQGSLAQFITNSSLLTNANLAQAGLTAGTEHTLFMIPSDADPLGRPQDPNFSAARGVATITLDNAMPAITDADTAIDGTLQTTLIGDTNTGLLGAGGTAGVDGLAVSQVAAPEIEIRDDAAPIAIGLDVQANDTIVRGLAMFGFGDDNGEAAVLVANNITGTLVEGNVFGTPANTFTDPGAARRGQAAVESLGGDSGIIRNNLIGFNAVRGVFLNGAATGWTIENNEYRDNGLSTTDGDGIAFSDASGNSITGNLIAGSSSQGIVVTNSSGNVFTNNTVSGNGVGTASGVAQSAGITLRSTASATTFDRNIVQANYGAGIQVNDGASGIRMTLNSINDNGTVTARDGSPATGQIGIDLNAPGDDINLGTAPFYTLNDVGDGDTGGNNLLNFPVIASATTSGPTTTVVGTLNSLPNTTFELEFYSSTSADASGYGEGETYRGNDTVTTDGSGNANFSTVLASTVPLGDAVTVTSTDPSGNTSEFSGALLAGSDLAITKRAFFPDGTPIPNTATVPSGVLFHFLLYINNPNGGRLDISMQDVLDPGFTYEAGTLRLDNSVASCAAAACTPAEEAAIFTSVAGSAPLTDAVDADAGSFNGGNTVDAGDQNAANAQVDIAGNSVLALLVSVRFP